MGRRRPEQRTSDQHLCRAQRGMVFLRLQGGRQLGQAIDERIDRLYRAPLLDRITELPPPARLLTEVLDDLPECLEPRIFRAYFPGCCSSGGVNDMFCPDRPFECG